MSTATNYEAQPARRAAIYTRISKDDRNDELGVQRQRKLCLELSQRLGWEVVGAPFEDNDTSAYRKSKPRKQFDAMVEAIRRGEVNAIAAYNPDRLTRDDLRGLEDLIDLLNAYDVAVATVRAGEFDLSTAHGRAQARMAGVWARLESEKMSERLRDKHTELVEAGKPNGGPRPFGWQRVGHRPERAGEADTRRLVPDTDEAPVVVEMIERVAGGQTLTRIAQDLNARGVRTARGSAWNVANVRVVVRNPVHAGRRSHKGRDFPAEWDGIVDEPTWRRAVFVLDQRNRNADGTPKRRSARRYLLSGGLLVCGGCAKPLFSKPVHGKHGSRPVYSCRPEKQGGCGGVSIIAEAVEELITAAVIRTVESTAYARQLRKRDGADPKIAAKASQLEAELEQLAALYGSGAITITEWTAARDGVNRRLAEARAALTTDTAVSAVGRYAGVPGALSEAWPSLSLDQRQAIVRAVVDHVVIARVGKGGKREFDPSRVGEPVWRS